MGIDVAWVDENHQPIQEVFDPSFLISRLATSRWPSLSSSVCLRFVDPCGDAVFNQAQIPELIRELNEEMSRPMDPQVRTQLEKVVRLIERSPGKVHTYIKFIGD
ncbi:hypothetical protein [Lysobacter tyrosinilyticus]